MLSQYKILTAFVFPPTCMARSCTHVQESSCVDLYMGGGGVTPALVYINRKNWEVPDKSEMDSQRTMNSWAVNTYENPVCDRGPSWVFRTTIKALLINEKKRLVYCSYSYRIYILTLLGPMALNRLNTWAISFFVGSAIFTNDPLANQIG